MRIRTPNPTPKGIGLSVLLGVGVLEAGTNMASFFLPCPFKSLTGIDCPGCGFQRSVAALWQGDFMASFQAYPPAIPILMLFAFLGLKWLFRWDRHDRVTRAAGLLVGGIVLLSYGIKMWTVVMPGHAH